MIDRPVEGIIVVAVDRNTAREIFCIQQGFLLAVVSLHPAEIAPGKGFTAGLLPTPGILCRKNLGK